MRVDMRALCVCVLVGVGLFVTGAAAQHEEHHQGQAAAPSGDTTSPGPHMQMMMMMDQKDTARLVDQLVASFATIESEKDPEMLKQELAEHGKLLKELQTKMQNHSHKMEMMHAMKDSDSKK